MTCPDDTFWAHLDFDVAIGNGGAIATETDGALTLTDVTFRDNVAAVGSALYAASPDAPDIKITNTTFDDVEHGFVGIGVAVSMSAEVIIDLWSRCMVSQLTTVPWAGSRLRRQPM